MSSGASPGAPHEMGLDLRDKPVRGAGLIEETEQLPERRRLMELSVQEKATLEHPLMIGDEEERVGKLGLVKAMLEV